MGERKAYLSPDEHEELLALADFAQKQTVEKLEAQTEDDLKATIQ